MKTIVTVIVGVLAIGLTFLFPWVMYDGKLNEVAAQARAEGSPDLEKAVTVAARTRYLQGELNLLDLEELESKTGRDYGRDLLRPELRRIFKQLPFLWEDYNFHVKYLTRDHGMYHRGFLIGLENNSCKLVFEKESNKTGIELVFNEISADELPSKFRSIFNSVYKGRGKKPSPYFLKIINKNK